MRLHHVALGAHDVERVAGFYVRFCDTTEVARHRYDDGRLRAIWLDLEDTVLMVEHTEAPERRVEGIGTGPFLLAFQVSPERRRALEQAFLGANVVIEQRTAYTSYVRDPEGNRVGFTHFPDIA